MFNFEVFLLCLLISSVFTGLVTEAVKKLLVEHNKVYRANTLAGIVSVGVSMIVGAGYYILTQASITSSFIFYIVALILLSWLCAMIGYDKVIQAISQFKITRED